MKEIVLDALGRRTRVYGENEEGDTFFFILENPAWKKPLGIAVSTEMWMGLSRHGKIKLLRDKVVEALKNE